MTGDNAMNAPQTIDATATRVITVNLPSQLKIQNSAVNFLAGAESLVIDSESMNVIAAEDLREVKAAYKKLEEARTFHVSPLNSEVKYINDYFRDALAKMEQAEGSIKRKMLAFQSEQDRLRREEQARINLAQETERKRVAVENAEREKAARQEAEAKLAIQNEAIAREKAAQKLVLDRQAEIDAAARAGDEQKEAALLVLQREAEELQARERMNAEQAGHEATQMLSQCAEQSAANLTAAMVMSPPVVVIAHKISGISTKGTYKGKCTDLLALVKFIAVNPQYLNLVKANDTAINQIAKAQRAATKIDGISVYEEQSISARSA